MQKLWKEFDQEREFFWELFDRVSFSRPRIGPTETAFARIKYTDVY